MSTIAKKKHYTPEDLLAMPDSVEFELVDGKLVRRGMGQESSWYGGLLYAVLLAFCRANKLGWVFPSDTSYQCFPGHPNKVRKPDVSVILFGRLPGGRPVKGHCPIAPDLAVEVLSPRDLASRLIMKIREYLQAGVRLIWILDPGTRTVEIHRQDGTVTLLKENEELSGEDVVPGFHCRVSELFPADVEKENP